MLKQLNFRGIIAAGNSRLEAVANYQALALGADATTYTDTLSGSCFVASASEIPFNPLSGELSLKEDPSIISNLSFSSVSGDDITATEFECVSGCTSHILVDDPALLKFCPVCSSDLDIPDTDDEESEGEESEGEESPEDEESEGEESESCDVSMTNDFEDEPADEELEESESSDSAEDESDEEDDSPEDEFDAMSSDVEGIVVYDYNFKRASDKFLAQKTVISGESVSSSDALYAVCSNDDCQVHVVSEIEQHFCPSCSSELVEPDLESESGDTSFEESEQYSDEGEDESQTEDSLEEPYDGFQTVSEDGDADMVAWPTEDDESEEGCTYKEEVATKDESECSGMPTDTLMAWQDGVTLVESTSRDQHTQLPIRVLSLQYPNKSVLCAWTNSGKDLTVAESFSSVEDSHKPRLVEYLVACDTPLLQGSPAPVIKGVQSVSTSVTAVMQWKDGLVLQESWGKCPTSDNCRWFNLMAGSTKVCSWYNKAGSTFVVDPKFASVEEKFVGYISAYLNALDAPLHPSDKATIISGIFDLSNNSESNMDEDESLDLDDQDAAEESEVEDESPEDEESESSDPVIKDDDEDDEDDEDFEGLEDDGTGEKLTVSALDKVDSESSVARLDVTYCANLIHGSQWIALYDNKPVASLSFSNAGANQDIFDKPGFGNAVLATAKSIGVSESLSSLGFIPYTTEVEVPAIASRLADERVLEVEASASATVSSYDDALCSALATAAVGLNRGFFTGMSNPIKDGLFQALSMAGVQNPNSLIANVFSKHSDGYHKVLFAKAKEIMSKPMEVRESLAKVILDSNYSVSSDNNGTALDNHLGNMGNVTPIKPSAPAPAVSVSSASAKPLGSYESAVASALSGLGNRKF